MDYLRIDENQLKITLTEEELLFYGMDLATVSYSNTETRRAFWAILDDAKRATGFDAAKTRVSVQIFASRSGGCEMFIIGSPNDGSATDFSLSHPRKNDRGISPLHGELCRVPTELTASPAPQRRFNRTTGEFCKLSDLLSACHALFSGGYDGESSAWQMNDRYYLHLDGTHGTKQEKPEYSASGVIAEFGSTVKDLSLAYFAEHGNCICKTRAVHQLAQMAT